MGQALLPEHFYAQEQSLREEFGLRLRLQAAPAWGLASLQWDEFQLQKGIVTLQELTLILRSGALIDIPGNTGPAFLNLNATGVTKTPLYLHLQSGYQTAQVGDAAADEAVERVIQKVELSINPYSATGVEAFKIAEVECGPDGLWAVSDAYVPPTVQLGTMPFFRSRMQRLEAVSRAIRQLLLEEIQQRYLAAEGSASTEQCLRGVFAFQAFLADADGEVHPHPYELFRALRQLYIDLCVYRGIQPAGLDEGYAHEGVAKSLDALMDALEQQVGVGRQQLPYVELKLQDGMFVCDIGKELRRAKDVYLLVQKPQISAELDLSRVKVASASRLQLVHERALRGIPVQKLERPPFHHGFTSSVEFFSFASGSEWDHALAEGKLVLYDAPCFKDCRLFVYWREE